MSHAATPTHTHTHTHTNPVIFTISVTQGWKPCLGDFKTLKIQFYWLIIYTQNYLWYTSSFFITADFFNKGKKLINVVWINDIQNYSSIKLRLHFKYEDIWLDNQTSLLRTFKGKMLFLR